MTDTLPIVKINANRWANLLTQSGVDLNSDIFVQNVGASDVLIVKTATEPTNDQAYQILEPRKIYRSDPAPSGLWAKCNNQNAVLSVQNQPITINGIPADLYTDNNRGGVRRLKTTATTSREVAVRQGSFFVRSETLADKSINSNNYTVISAAAGKYLIINNITTDAFFSSSADGQYNITLSAYSSLSNDNTFSYSTNNPAPVGKSVNTDFINNAPDSTIDRDVNITTLTGDIDYPLCVVDYVVDTSGNRNNMGAMTRSLFDQSAIIIAPNSDLLIAISTDGTATGSATIDVVYYATEVTTTDFLGV